MFLTIVFGIENTRQLPWKNWSKMAPMAHIVVPNYPTEEVVCCTICCAPRGVTFWSVLDFLTFFDLWFSPYSWPFCGPTRAPNYTVNYDQTELQQEGAMCIHFGGILKKILKNDGYRTCWEVRVHSREGIVYYNSIIHSLCSITSSTASVFQ